MVNKRTWLAFLALLLACAPHSARAAATVTAAAVTEHIVLFKPEVAVEVRREIIEKAGGKVIRELPFIDGMLVRLPDVQQKEFQSLEDHPRIEAIEENTYRRWIETTPAVDWDSPGSASATPWQALRGNPGFDFPENRPGFDAPVPASRPAAPQRTGEIPWGVARVKAPAVWSRTRGKGVKVAVIDTGIDSSHPDLAPNYAGGYNAVDPSAPPMDDQGHGTHVAGTIAAAENHLGVVGVAPEASLYAVKVLDADGGGTPATIVDGIEWATRNHMDVINMSLGGPMGSAALRRAVEAALAAGVTVVAASGNDPQQPVGVPAKYPGVIAVSAMDTHDKLAYFSSTGPEVAFIAPGVDVLSDAPGEKLAVHSGTSMATPHVTGLAALAIGLGAHGPAQVRAMLQKAAVPLAGLSGDDEGAGVIEADRLGR